MTDIEHSPAFRIRNALLTITRCWPHMLPTGPAATTTGTIGRHATTSRPPVADHIIDARLTTLGYLASWACRVAVARDLKAAIPEHDPYPLAKLLSAHADWIVDLPDAHKALEHFEEAARACKGIAEPHDRAKFAGTCDLCQGDLMGDDRRVRCKQCKAVVDGPTQQERVRVRVKDRFMTAAELVNLSPQVGRRVQRVQVDRWIRRERIEAKTTTPEGKPLYSVSAFLDWLTPDETQQRSA